MSILSFIEKAIDNLFACIPRVCHKKNLRDIKLIAHRGAHDKNTGLIENTLPAFDKAQILGCWGIEFDVQFTKDGVAVVHHDPDLLRLWGRNVRIDGLTMAELRNLVPEIPTFVEVIERYGKKMHLFIELKISPPQEEVFFQQLSSLTPGQDYHLLSLKEPIFAQLKLFPTTALLLVAEHNNLKLFCQQSIEKEYGGVLGHYLLLTQRNMRRLHQAKQHLGVGFIDSRSNLIREINRGHYWLFTNNAHGVAPILQELVSGQN